MCVQYELARRDHASAERLTWPVIRSAPRFSGGPCQVTGAR